ncbi:endonuclease/exonuclease/phosphatase family protein [Haloarcula salina]|uniref:Endonuclease/exonuclease/phosphatase family protein n=1 Tax=Haloarcula salina TaxID=1429914 RepID=A0AA41FXS2_9EURY|nr:endonuclease/exonuclease/phosphatase family protein [Haloarcula salina]MBV0900583.1 endonuclease/exonuclease/phosphatase family protein [Haloarcula salina]
MKRTRVMSYNVRYDTAGDGLDAWPHRRRLVASIVRYHDPDVVGIQEAMAHQLRELESLLPDYEWVGDPRDSVDAGGEHTAVGYRTERFACEETDTFWLSEQPSEPSSVGWDASYPRVATWARLRDRDTDEPLLCLNTHLDHTGERARVEGIDLVLDRLDEVVGDAPAVVIGDFNCVVGEPAHERAEGHALPDGRALEDARDAAAATHGPTTSRTDFHDLLPEMGIDHVFVSGDLSVATRAVLADRDDDHYGSDHLPVVVDVDR